MHQQYHRRTFRGRGGATDRRLPKHNAARRRPPPEPSAVRNDVAVPNEPDDDWDDESDECSDAEYALQILEPEDVVTEEYTTDIPAEAADTSEPLNDKSIPPQARLELEHLRRRIRNNRTSMSLSAVAMANPSSYQSNVLAACLNTAKELRSIVRQYNLDDETKTAVGCTMFGLIQQSLQCGPLAGAKPGYFKRCGSDMAGIIHRYLTDLVPEGTNAHDTLGFSATQSQAIQRWTQDAKKAMLSGKAPSKSVVKAQDKAVRRNK